MLFFLELILMLCEPPEDPKRDVGYLFKFVMALLFLVGVLAMVLLARDP